MARLFTRTGDDGTTATVGGVRVAKDSLPIEAVGAVDELNVVLGMVPAQGVDEKVRQLLKTIQSDLFNLGADLSSGESGTQITDKSRMRSDAVEYIEQTIEEFTQLLPPLTHFVLPGGSEAAAALHLARAVCRRAERRVVALHREQAVAPTILPYLNRLSDLLFILARYQNQKDGVAEEQWPVE